MKIKSLTPIKIIIAFFLISMSFGCNESDDKEITNEQIDSYTGEIVLPDNSSVDASTLNVTSSTTQGQNNAGIVEVEELDNYNALYLTNQNDEVMLMYYKYPDNPNGNINATSTALGLVMMTPSLVFLSDEGKQTLINTLLPSVEFQALVDEVEQNLVNNRNLFDTTNISLMEALTDLFQSISQRSTDNNDSAPVNVLQSGRNFIFNAGEGTVPNVFTTVIGVYKDDQRIEKIVVKGVQLVPNSVTDILSGNGSTFDDPINYNYTLDDDGEFTFKYRTGKPGFGDGSLEHDEAFYENSAQFSANLVQTFLPTIELNASALTCFVTIAKNTISTSSSISSNSSAGIGTMLYAVNEILLNNINSILNNCSLEAAQQDWFTSFLGQWNFINTAFDVISNLANTTIFATQWGLSNAVYDECYSANGNDVEDCGCNISSYTDPRDGQEYPIVQIGEQCWFAKNLNYATGNSWCYDDNQSNCTTYGRLYDWETVMNGAPSSDVNPSGVQGVCPAGWHLPSHTEWTQLTNFLGGQYVAGGEMKSTSSLWNAPNTGATNSSGFSGLPGGSKINIGDGEPDLFFYALGNSGVWWSSTEDTEDDPDQAWARFVDYNGENVRIGSSDKIRGYSCRCLKD